MLKQELLPRESNSTLGDIVRTFYDFMNNGKCSPSYQVASPVDSNQLVYADKFFNKIGKNFIVKKERLPFDLNVRAILSHGANVLIETTKIDFDALNSWLSSSIENKGKSFFVNEEKVIQTRTQNVEKEHYKKDLRTVSEILAPYGTENLELALEVIDNLYNQNCFCDLEKVCTLTNKANISSVAKIGLKPQLDLEQTQIMETIQSPKLSLGMKFSMQTGYLKVRGKILEMNHSELAQFLRGRY